MGPQGSSLGALFVWQPEGRARMMSESSRLLKNKRISKTITQTHRHQRTYAKCYRLERRIAKATRLLERALETLRSAD